MKHISASLSNEVAGSSASRTPRSDCADAPGKGVVFLFAAVSPCQRVGRIGSVVEVSCIPPPSRGARRPRSEGARRPARAARTPPQKNPQLPRNGVLINR
jgi:hypothetical protein